MESYSVKEVALLAGVSVRTLHYYDEVNLLKPFVNQENKYRIYDNRDIEKLQQILFFKELGFKISEIKNIVDSPDFDRVDALKSQRDLIYKKIDRYMKIVDTVSETISSLEKGENMKKEKLFKGLDFEEINAHKEKYKKEVKEKYDSDLVRESNKRTSKYSKEKWGDIQSESSSIFNKLASLMDKDVSDIGVQKLVTAYHKHIDTYFYPCSYEIYRGLGEMYVADERFTEFYDNVKIGLSAFIKDAITYYVDNQK
ncbi:MAG: MerR family transcriptional regulator [Acidaminobacteraceae bacterium]